MPVGGCPGEPHAPLAPNGKRAENISCRSLESGTRFAQTARFRTRSARLFSTHLFRWHPWRMGFRPKAQTVREARLIAAAITTPQSNSSLTIQSSNPRPEGQLFDNPYSNGRTTSNTLPLPAIPSSRPLSTSSSPSTSA